MKRIALAALCLGGGLWMARPAQAQETTTYTYDSLGRLTGSSTSGTVNNGMQTSTGFDPAGNRTNYAVSPNSSATVTFSISGPLPVVEGGTLVYTVTKSGTNASTISVNYATANGTATSGSDYTVTSGTLSFSPTDVTKTLSVPTINDGTAESSETVLVNLSGATGGATITYSQASGTITDND